MLKKKPTKVILKHTDVMSALGKATGGDLGKAFREDPSDENREAILRMANKGLKALQKKAGG